MPQYYPVFLNIAGRLVTVVGGGEIAERKILSLLSAGARVKAIAPSFTAELRQLVERGGLEALPRPYSPGDLAGSVLAIAATQDQAVNHAVVQEARQRGIPVNVVDKPTDCDFIVPSVLKRGDLVIAIATGGHSPALARWLRQELERTIGPEYESLLSLLSHVRTKLRLQGKSPLPQRWQEAITPELIELVRQGQMEQAEAQLLACLHEGNSSDAPVTAAVATVLAALKNKAEHVRQQELREAFKKSPHLSPEQKRRLDTFSQAIVDKIIHQSLVALQDGDTTLSQVVVELFDLKREPGSRGPDRHPR